MGIFSYDSGTVGERPNKEKWANGKKKTFQKLIKLCVEAARERKQ